VRQGNGFVLEDKGTTGGTLLNGERITAPTPLKSGDRIQVGGSILSFGERRKDAAAATPTVPQA
jgi:pSer/pThr/pTyr-binding forkhead associated (FHA) protein